MPAMALPLSRLVGDQSDMPKLTWIYGRLSNGKFAENLCQKSLLIPLRLESRKE
jgi:hypothetical protein